MLYRFQPIGSVQQALLLELNAGQQANCAGSFAVAVSDENALVYDLVPGHKLRVDSFREQGLNWVELLITNGCFERLDKVKYDVQAILVGDS